MEVRAGKAAVDRGGGEDAPFSPANRTQGTATLFPFTSWPFLWTWASQSACGCVL